jgi:hypothetical protein
MFEYEVVVFIRNLELSNTNPKRAMKIKVPQPLYILKAKILDYNRI